MTTVEHTLYKINYFLFEHMRKLVVSKINIMANNFEHNNTCRYKLSVGIDFGTTTSAMAFSYQDNQEDIFVFHNYGDGVPTHGKIPTAILFDKNQTFIAFGNSAILRYEEYAMKEQHKDVYFFQNFKMNLYTEDKNINEDMMVSDIMGKQMKAFDVFRTAIKFFQTTILSDMKQRKESMNIVERDCKWVVTVPAIWGEKAKQFMRTAAEKAGCFWRSISMALEPEAASIYCRQSRKVLQDNYNIIQQKECSKYLIVDIGGGTLDIAAHQISKDQSIVEIHRASGNDLAGNKVDEAFVKLMETLFSNENLKEIREEHPNEFIKIMQEFWQAKQKVVLDNVAEVPIVLSNDCPWNKRYFENLTSDIKRGIYLTKRGGLFIPKQEVDKLIKPVSEKIQSYIASLLRENDELKELDFIVLVGGFSKSKIVINDIKNVVKLPVIVPEHAELCVVKGAVMFGWKEDIIRSRKSRKSYGIGINKVFVEGRHDEKRAYFDIKGGKRCEGCFHQLITINEDVQINHKVTYKCYHSYVKDGKTDLLLYATDDPNPLYYGVEGVVSIGRIFIPRPESAYGKSILIEVYFGQTEIKVIAKDEHSGKTFEGNFSFLSNNVLKVVD